MHCSLACPRLVLLSLSVLAIGLPAWGQNAEPSPPPDEQEPPLADVQEEMPADAVGESIVVTARKREEDLQEVPVAVSVVSGEALEDSGARDIADLQSRVPNLSIYAGRNQSTTLTVFMRGVGQSDPLWGVDPGVGLYLDGVYVARPQGALLDVYDVERVEVLRGPQGTLYGKNTIGGAIKYVSRPLGDRLDARIALTGGSNSEQDVRAVLSGALVPGRLRAKLALASLRHDGYGTNLFTGEEVSDQDTLAYRAALEWLPSNAVSVRLSYDNTKDEAQPKGLTRLAANPFCPALSGGACPPEKELFDTRSGLVPRNGTDSQGYSLNVSWTLSPAWRLQSITAHRESESDNNIDFDTTPGRIADVIGTTYDEQASEELQVLYDGGGAFTGVFGAYYFDGEAGGVVKNIFLNGAGGFTTSAGHTKTDSMALFGDLSYDFNPSWTLELGLRATRERKNGVAFNGGYSSDTFTEVITVLADFDQTATFDSLAPRVGLDYRFSDRVMGYLSLSRGFKSGGFNIRAQAMRFPESAEPFDDELLDVAEAGLKSALADGSLVLNSAVFYGRYSDIQVSTFTAFDSDGDGTEDAFFGNFLNAGDATIQGVEVEYDWTPRAADWFGLAGNIAYLDARPDEFLDANGDGFVDTQVITNAPKWSGAVRAHLGFPAFRGLVTGSLAWSYRDDSALTNEGGQVPGQPGVPLLPITQPAYDAVDAWVSWLSPDARWRLGMAGKNLTDEQYLTSGFNVPALGILQGSYGAPRTVTATVEYRF